MIKKTSAYALGVVLLLGSLAGCTPSGEPTNEGVGAVTGGIIGGVIGSQIFGQNSVAGLIVGSAVGAMVGANIGRYMDEQDRLYMREAIIENDIGESRRWTNERTHVTYTVTPVRRFHRHDRPCRTYKTRIVVEGEVHVAEGTACLMPNGRWQIKS